MAYEDQRTILPTGLLSTASKPAYQPKPVVMSFPSSGKPDPEHKNPDKELQRQKRIQQQQLEMQQQQSGGGTVICTAYYDLGWMDEKTYQADELFGLILAKENPELMLWYWYHAPWWVAKMKYPWFRKALWWFVKPWAEHMAYEVGVRGKDNRVGKFLMRMGRILAYA